jgi:hypothetical protein
MPILIPLILEDGIRYVEIRYTTEKELESLGLRLNFD